MRMRDNRWASEQAHWQSRMISTRSIGRATPMPTSFCDYCGTACPIADSKLVVKARARTIMRHGNICRVATGQNQCRTVLLRESNSQKNSYQPLAPRRRDTPRGFFVSRQRVATLSKGLGNNLWPLCAPCRLHGGARMEYEKFTINAFEQAPGKWHARVRRANGRSLVAGRQDLIEFVTEAESLTAVEAMTLAMEVIDAGGFAATPRTRSEKYWRLTTGRKGA
jgi:hypothetical protein